MADVLVTHSYHLPYDPKQLQKMQPYMPLATLCAATALRQVGISVAAFDSMLKDPISWFPETLAMHTPAIVAVYEDDFNFLSKMCLTRMREVAWEIAAAARAIGAVTIVHGSDSNRQSADSSSNMDSILCAVEKRNKLWLDFVGQFFEEKRSRTSMALYGLIMKVKSFVARNASPKIRIGLNSPFPPAILSTLSRTAKRG